MSWHRGTVFQRRYALTAVLVSSYIVRTVAFAADNMRLDRPHAARQSPAHSSPVEMTGIEEFPASSDETEDGEADSGVTSAAYLPEQVLDQPGLPPRDEEWNEPEEAFNPGDASSEADTTTSAAPASPRRIFSDNVDGFTWLIPRDGFGVGEYDARTAVVIPLFLGGPPPKLAVGFGATTFETPDGFDVPDTLYNVQVELRWLRPINDSMALDLAAGPSWFTDFNTSAGRGLRVTGRALLFMTNSETVKSAVGVVYLGRKGLVAVPAVGLIYSPSEEERYELMIPRPRAVWRLAKGEASEHWVYVGAELFGGNSWAIDLPDGSEDVFIYRDYRLLAGYEFKQADGLSLRGEAGFVFARKAEFESDPRELEPGTTGFVRAVLSF